MAKIGMILNNPKQYSETFLRSKIKYLAESGHSLFVFGRTPSAKKNNVHYVKLAPVRKGRLPFLVFYLTAFVKLVFKPKRLFRFWMLEQKKTNSCRKTVRTVLLNAPLLLHTLDWLHFSFLTLTIDRENVAEVIGAKMSSSIRGYDICIYPYVNPGCYREIWPKLDKLHYLSSDLLEQAIKHGYNKSCPAVKIPPAIDLTFFKCKKRTYHFNDPVKLISVSRLVWKKGLTYALKAVLLLRRKGIAVQLEIIGTGEQYEELMFQIHVLGLRDRVFLSGALNPEQVRDRLQAADIYIQPSVQEGFCNAVLEAQAMGLPCIVSNAGGLSENILDGQTGWVVPKRNSEALAQKIEDILSLDTPAITQITQQAQHRVKREFNIEKQKEQFLSFFD